MENAVMDCESYTKNTNIGTALSPNYLSIKQWVSTFGYIPEGGVRHLIYGNEDFRKKVIRKIGTKILIDVKAMELWISQQIT